MTPGQDVQSLYAELLEQDRQHHHAYNQLGQEWVVKSAEETQQWRETLAATAMRCREIQEELAPLGYEVLRSSYTGGMVLLPRARAPWDHNQFMPHDCRFHRGDFHVYGYRCR